MPRICRPINPMEGRDYLTLDGRVRPAAASRGGPLSGSTIKASVLLLPLELLCDGSRDICSMWRVPPGCGVQQATTGV
jgi:hypothetical protein